MRWKSQPRCARVCSNEGPLTRALTLGSANGRLAAARVGSIGIAAVTLLHPLSLASSSLVQDGREPAPELLPTTPRRFRRVRPFESAQPQSGTRHSLSGFRPTDPHHGVYSRMARRWIYSIDGSETAYYQQGKYLYSAKTNECEYYQSGEQIYRLIDSDRNSPAFCVRENRVYSMDGKPLYYYD
jgi:hypothetical protein